jgi:dolichol kinase
MPLHIVEALDSGAFRAAGLELAAAMITGMVALPLLAVGGHSVAKSEADHSSESSRRLGVPVVARAMRMLGIPPIWPCDKKWEWVGALGSMIVVAVGWDFVCGTLLLGENPLVWLLRFLANCDDVSIQQWEDAAPETTWWGGLALGLRPIQSAVMMSLSHLGAQPAEGGGGTPLSMAMPADGGGSVQGADSAAQLVAPPPPPTRLLICLLWCVAVPVQLLVARAISQANAPQIVVRKLFHGAAALMLAPAIVADPGLVAIAGAGALRLIVMGEVLRSSGMPVVSALVSKAIAPFVDGRDGGALVMTHVYLLGGCLLPVWLMPLAADASLRHGTSASPWLLWVLFPQSGVLAVAVSDAAAAAYGRLAGSLPWAWAKPKTVEGTTAGAVASSLCVLLLALTVPVPQSGGLVWASWSEVGVGCLIAVLVSLHETFTSLIDNMATPVYAVALTAAVATLPQLSAA